MRKTPREKLLELLGAQVDKDTPWYKQARKYKEQLLKQIASHLDRREGESQSELIQRLMSGGRGGSISTRKLLKLYEQVQRLKEEFEGSKNKLIDALLQLRVGKSGKIDEEYRRHLQKQSIGRLFLSYDHARKTGLFRTQ